jgi:hypothetical protein
MPLTIKESDWKLFRRLHKVALERFCKQVIQDVNKVTADVQGDFHKHYIALWKLIRDRDQEIAYAFNDMRRSTAIAMIANVHELDLFTPEEFSEFSPETRDTVDRIVESRPSHSNDVMKIK